MRKMQKPPAEKLRKKKQEPLAEVPQIAVPTDPSGRRLWSRMNDEEIVKLAKKIVEERGISRKKELENADSGLYAVLVRRKLLNKIEFEEKRRSWSGMTDEEIIEFARKFMDENRINGRKDLENADRGLYQVVMRKKLFERIGIEKKQRSWKGVSDEEIIIIARGIMKEKGISRRAELEDSDLGVYTALRKRGLLNKVGFAQKRWEERSWKDLRDEEVVGIAREVIREKKIANRSKLNVEDSSLCSVLRKRGLLDKVGLENKRRSWSGMTDEEIIESARKIIEENEIIKRDDLKKHDSGLYEILRIRGVLDSAFTQVDQKRNGHARDAVIDALEAFTVANDNASAEDDVA